jgi:hypothetical protein
MMIADCKLIQQLFYVCQLTAKDQKSFAELLTVAHVGSYLVD